MCIHGQCSDTCVFTLKQSTRKGVQTNTKEGGYPCINWNPLESVFQYHPLPGIQSYCCHPLQRDIRSHPISPDLICEISGVLSSDHSKGSDVGLSGWDFPRGCLGLFVSRRLSTHSPLHHPYRAPLVLRTNPHNPTLGFCEIGAGCRNSVISGSRVDP